MKAPASFGRYFLEEEIGAGGMAQVYRAKSVGIEGFEKTVVIKRILPNLSKEREFVEMFISEAKLAVSLNHPNIVQVFDLGKEKDVEGQESIFIAMEFVDGGDLAELLKRRIEQHRRAFPPVLAAYVVAEVAKALDYAHRRRDPQGRALGLVHRDISPQNILISLEGDVKLTDFGIAKIRAARRRTEVGVLKGKYGYMSPEQVRGEAIDGRADLFALGIVFYELLAGRRLFRGESPVETLSMIEETRIPDPKHSIPGLPEIFIPILERALTRYPEDRYSSAAELAGDLLALLFAMGKPMQRDEMGTFTRELLPKVPKKEAPKSNPPIDTSSLLDALQNKSVEPGAKDTSTHTSSTRGKHSTTRRTINTKGLISQPKQSSKVFSSPRFKTKELEKVEPVFVLAAPRGSQGFLQVSSSRARRIIYRYRGRLGPEGEQGALVAFFGEGLLDASTAERAARCALELVALAPQEKDPKIALVYSELPTEGVYREAAERAASPAKDLASQAGSRQVLIDKKVSQLLGDSLPQRPWTKGEGALLDPEAARYIPPLSSETVIGRRAEIRALINSLAKAAEGKGQIATLTGPPGSGKTRLLSEMKSLLKERQIGWVSGRCTSMVVPEPYHLIRDIFDYLAGCVGKTNPKEIRTRLERLRLFKLSDRELDLIFRLHPSTKGLPLGEIPPVLSVLEVLMRVIDEFTSLHPLVLALEDLQWIDGFSRDVLSLLFERVSLKSLFLITTWRIVEMNRPTQGITISLLPPAEGELRFPEKTKTVFLPPLSEAEVEKLTTTLLGVNHLEQDLGALMAKLSGGNPFFVMELLRSYLEKDQLEIQEGKAFLLQNKKEVNLVPVTLQAILQERLTTLGPIEMKIVNAAAILGPRFFLEDLQLGLGTEAGSAEQVAEQLSQKGVFAQNLEDRSFAFADMLLREVIAENILPQEKQSLHNRLASAAAKRFSETKFPQDAARAAYHYDQAKKPELAAPLWESVADSCAAAGDLRGAFERYRFALESKRAFRAKGAALLPLAIKAADAMLARGDMIQGSKFLDDLVADLPKTEVETLSVFTQLRGELALQAGNLEEARKLLDQAAAQSTKRSIGVHAARLPLSRGRAALFAGDPQKAIEHLAEAVSFANVKHNTRFLAGALSALGRAHVYAGQAERAKQCFAESIQLARDAKDTHTLCRALLRRAILPFMHRDFQAALDSDREALLLAEAEGFEALAAHAEHYVGVDLVYLEDPGRAYSMLERSAVSANELGLLVLAWTNEAYLGYLDTLLHPDGPGLRRLLNAKEKLSTVRARPKIAQAYYLLGKVNLARKSHFLAKRHLQDSLRLAEEIGHRFLVGEIQRLFEELEMS